jgi:hypothetical protein
LDNRLDESETSDNARPVKRAADQRGGAFVEKRR